MLAHQSLHYMNLMGPQQSQKEGQWGFTLHGTTCKVVYLQLTSCCASYSLVSIMIVKSNSYHWLETAVSAKIRLLLRDENRAHSDLLKHKPIYI